MVRHSLSAGYRYTAWTLSEASPVALEASCWKVLPPSTGLPEAAGLAADVIAVAGIETEQMQETGPILPAAAAALTCQDWPVIGRFHQALTGGHQHVGGNKGSAKTAAASGTRGSSCHWISGVAYWPA